MHRHDMIHRCNLDSLHRYRSLQRHIDTTSVQRALTHDLNMLHDRLSVILTARAPSRHLNESRKDGRVQSIHAATFALETPLERARSVASIIDFRSRGRTSDRMRQHRFRQQLMASDGGCAKKVYAAAIIGGMPRAWGVAPPRCSR